MPVIPALKCLRKKDLEFRAVWATYRVRPCVKMRETTLLKSIVCYKEKSAAL